MKKSSNINHICLQAAFWPACIIVILSIATSALQLKYHIRSLIDKEAKQHQLISQDVSTALVPNLIINNSNAVKVILEHFKTKHELVDLQVKTESNKQQPLSLFNFLKNQRVSTSWNISGLQPAQFLVIDTKIDKQTLLIPFLSMVLIIWLFIGASIMMYQRIKKKLTAEIAVPLTHVLRQGEQSDDWFKKNSAATEIIELYQKTNTYIQVLHQQRDAIEANNIKQAKYDIALQMAHDIRSPVLALETMCDLIPEAAGTAKVMINNATKRISQIANDILNEYLPSQQKSKTKLCAESILPISDIVKSLFEEKQASCLNKDISFELIIDDLSQDALVNISEKHLNRVLSNIIDNSIQAITTNGVIQIIVSSYIDSISIFIKDTGCGIQPENLNHVFDKGFSLKPDGKGLGLQHAKEIIEKHGGKIQLGSICGKGTTINIVFHTEQSIT